MDAARHEPRISDVAETGDLAVEDAAVWAEGVRVPDRARWDRAFAAGEAVAERPLFRTDRVRRPTRRRWLGRAWRAVAAAAIVAGLAWLAAERPGAEPAEAMLGLAFVPEAPAPVGLDPAGAARARGSFAARQAVYARVGADPGDGALFVVLARLAAEDGLGVTRLASRPAVATRLGPAEAVEATLDAGEGTARDCTGWRLPSAGLAGLVCAGAGEVLEGGGLLRAAGLAAEAAPELGPAPARELGGNREARRASTPRPRRGAAAARERG